MRYPRLLSSLLILGLSVFARDHCSAESSGNTSGTPDEKPIITLMFVGDTGFNQSRRNVRTDGVIKNGVFQTWQQSVSNIRGILSGDLMFANVETVVTDRKNLVPRDRNQSRGFFFRSHPNGFRQLTELGFNLFSLANN
ncbi:MAG: CapA family protein, partial [Methyloligellaceae bacterium]